MNWKPKTNLLVVLFMTIVLVGAGGCGVKGDPLPPEKPTELGRGRPNYRRATQGLNLKSVPDPKERSDESLEEGEEDAEDE